MFMSVCLVVLGNRILVDADAIILGRYIGMKNWDFCPNLKCKKVMLLTRMDYPKESVWYLILRGKNRLEWAVEGSWTVTQRNKTRSWREKTWDDINLWPWMQDEYKKKRPRNHMVFTYLLECLFMRSQIFRASMGWQRGSKLQTWCGSQ